MDRSGSCMLHTNTAPVGRTSLLRTSLLIKLNRLFRSCTLKAPKGRGQQGRLQDEQEEKTTMDAKDFINKIKQAMKSGETFTHAVGSYGSLSAVTAVLRSPFPMTAAQCASWRTQSTVLFLPVAARKRSLTTTRQVSASRPTLTTLRVEGP